MPKVINSTTKIKTNMWRWNPDKTHSKNAFSHKKWDGATKGHIKIKKI